MKDLSIIIPCSRGELIYNCLESLIKNNLGGLLVEIIIVENPQITIDKNSLPDSEKIILKIIRSPANHPSKMRNLGAKRAEGKYFVFLDDDTYIPKNWLKSAYEILEKKPENIICGPNVDENKNFSNNIANAIQSLYISDGLKTHITKNKAIEVNFHNIPLNNCAMKREIFNKIGGFNDQVDYYLDDVEFFYIAHKLGYKFSQYPELAIQHYCRKFPFDFLKYKFYARKKIGHNAFFFPELYHESFSIRLIFLTYLLIPALIYLFFGKPGYFFFLTMFISLLYVLIITFSSLMVIIVHRDLKYLILPIGIFLTHLANYVGFTVGIISGLMSFGERKKIKEIKKIRYAIFFNKNN